jgi:hypothetical protein
MPELPEHQRGLDLAERREQLRFAADEILDHTVVTSHVGAYAALRSAEALLAAVERVLALDVDRVAAAGDGPDGLAIDPAFHAGVEYALTAVRQAIQGEQ